MEGINAIDLRKQKIEAANKAILEMKRSVLAALGDDFCLGEIELVLNGIETQLYARMQELDIIERMMEGEE